MYPWRRILIPTDFSTASEWAFDDAIQLAGSTGAELVVLHIRITRSSHPDELRFPADDALYEYAEKQELDTLRERARRANASVAARLVVKKAPDPGAEICRSARAEATDLIVIATHARHHVAHLLIGSTTMQVINDPPAPVLAIRYGTPRRRGFHRIVVPVHLQQTSDAAVRLAAAIAQKEGSEIHLLILCADRDRNAAETRLDAVASQSLAGITPKRVVLKADDVDREIVRYAAESNADAVFINAHREIGAVKREIIRHIGTRVMIVPSQQEV
jgi:nucleotide-binding universal stress UspA family protein